MSALYQNLMEKIDKYLKNDKIPFRKEGYYEERTKSIIIFDNFINSFYT